MTQKYYVDPNGKYIGSWDGSEPDANLNAVEVKTPPQSIEQTWNFSTKKWSAYIAPAPVTPELTVAQLTAQLKTKGVISDIDITTAATIGK